MKSAPILPVPLLVALLVVGLASFVYYSARLARGEPERAPLAAPAALITIDRHDGLQPALQVLEEAKLPGLALWIIQTDQGERFLVANGSGTALLRLER